MLAHLSASVPSHEVSSVMRGFATRNARMSARMAGRMRVVAKAGALAWGKEMGGEADHPRHIPVLLAEVMEALAIGAGGRYIDATFGAGGYSRAMLRANETTRVLAIDRDPDAVRAGEALVDEAARRLSLVQRRFGEIASVARELGFGEVDGVVFDIGVSSMQIDTPERGFSFRQDGPLDMRMSRAGPSAADIVATMSADALADVLRFYGEERHAGRIARAIVAARQEAPIRTTSELRRIIASAVRPARDGIDPATRTFQALRIAVNDELNELVRGLVDAASVLAPGGRLVVVSFHSLEDRIVKRFLQGKTAPGLAVSRHLPTQPRPTQAFAPIGGPIAPSEAEVARNPRARSAKLRWGVRRGSPLPPDILRLVELAALPRRGAPRRRRA
jgi:16S rRNA (cytosine1402-N4)-methyltransferase